jgi:hypothetical protein
MQVHQETDDGMQFQPPMSPGAMQINRGAEDRHLHDYKRHDGHPQVMHSGSSGKPRNTRFERFFMLTDLFDAFRRIFRKHLPSVNRGARQ